MIIINSVISCHGAKFAFFDVIFKFFPPLRIDENISESRLLTSWQNFLINITYKLSLTTYGYILNFLESDMAYPRVES